MGSMSMALVSLKKAAKALSKSEKTLRRWIKDGAPCEKDRSGAYLMNVEELQLWKRERDQAKGRGRVTRRPRPATANPKRRTARPADPVGPNETPAISPVEPEIADAVIDHDAEVLAALREHVPKPPTSPRATVVKTPRPNTLGRSTATPEEKLKQLRAKLEAEPEIPNAADLRRRAVLNTLLQGAASATITRLPERAIDLRDLKREHEDTWGLTRAELREIVEAGGFLPWLNKNRGRGHYRVTWNGAMGQLLHSEVLTLATEWDGECGPESPSPEIVAKRKKARDEAIARWIGDHRSAGLVEAMRRGVQHDDMAELSAALGVVLESCAPYLFPAPLYSSRVCLELNPFLPPPPEGFIPWVNFMPPPGPTPKQRWVRDWLAAFDREHRSRTGLGAKRELVETQIAPHLWSRIHMLFPRPPGDPAVWGELARFLPRRQRRA
jgi:hypothetical protein